MHKAVAIDGNNYIVQTQAMINHDAFDAETERYASNLKGIAADLLAVSVPGDHMVNPTPAKNLAKSIGAKLVEIDSNSGHMRITCEDANVARQVNAFLR